MKNHVQHARLKPALLSILLCASFLLAVPAASAGKTPQKTAAELMSEITALATKSAKQGEDAEAYEAFHALVDQLVAIYRADPASDEGYAAMKFASQAPWLADEVYPLLAQYHLEKPDIHQIIAEAGSWQAVRNGKVAFLKELIKHPQVSPLIRTRASVALAQDYLTVAEFLSTLEEFGITWQAYAAQAEQQYDAEAVEFVQHNFIYARAKEGRIPGRDFLRQRAQALLAEAAKKASSTELTSVQQTPKGEIEVAENEQILKQIADIRHRLQHMAPGAMAPDVDNLVNYDGESVQISHHRGKVLLLDFWATWCGPCVASMPDNRKLAEHMKGRPFELITLSVDGDMEDAAEFMEENNYAFTNWYIGPEHAILKDWGIKAYPTVIVVDHKGVIRARPRVDHELLVQYIQRLVMEAEQP